MLYFLVDEAGKVGQPERAAYRGGSHVKRTTLTGVGLPLISGEAE
jgi:hypothetical protein